MLIVYVGVKGGGGKTTLSVSHAGWLFDGGCSVGFLDGDVQKLGSIWLKKAEPKIEVRQATTPAEVEKQIQALSAKHEFIVADSPGGTDKQNAVLIKRADLCVVPVMASPLDVHSAFAGAKQFIKAVNRRDRRARQIRFVINGLDDRTSLAKEMRRFANRMDPPATKASVRRLTALVKAANLKSPEIPTRMRNSHQAKRDLENLFAELMDLVKHQPAKRAANE